MDHYLREHAKHESSARINRRGLVLGAAAGLAPALLVYLLVVVLHLLTGLFGSLSALTGPAADTTTAALPDAGVTALRSAAGALVGALPLLAGCAGIGGTLCLAQALGSSTQRPWRRYTALLVSLGLAGGGGCAVGLSLKERAAALYADRPDYFGWYQRATQDAGLLAFLGVCVGLAVGFVYWYTWSHSYTRLLAHSPGARPAVAAVAAEAVTGSGSGGVVPLVWLSALTLAFALGTAAALSAAEQRGARTLGAALHVDAAAGHGEQCLEAAMPLQPRSLRCITGVGSGVITLRLVGPGGAAVWAATVMPQQAYDQARLVSATLRATAGDYRLCAAGEAPSRGDVWCVLTFGGGAVAARIAAAAGALSGATVVTALALLVEAASLLSRAWV